VAVFFCIVLVALYIVGASFAVDEKDMEFGATFAYSFAANFSGVDWKEAYVAILDDLKVKKIRIPAYWNQIERGKGTFVFDDLDWQIKEAEKRGVGVILTVGRRVPRWPECHVPAWAQKLSEEEVQPEILGAIEKIVLRYRDSSAVYLWQVENEPFLSMFGECPAADPEFLDKEIALVRSLDPQHRKILISDSGEFGLWVRAAARGDIFGTTMYRVVLTRLFGQITYPIPPGFFKIKTGIVKLLYGFDKEILVIELQAEPWGSRALYESSLEVHKESMDHEQFLKNIAYAKATGFREFFLWGAEWWYWAKTTQNDPFYWNEAKKLFQQ
jgi:hypothetical protein